MDITHDASGKRFVSALDEGKAEIAYMERGKVLDLMHTFVPPSARGQGIGEALVEHAFTYAEENGYRIQASCPFVRAWLQDNPDWRRLVDGA